VVVAVARSVGFANPRSRPRGDGKGDGKLAAD